MQTYRDAGQKYGIPWSVLAAIHKIESNFAVSGNVQNSSGALGPMQFMPSTFKVYGVTAPGRKGSPDINNVYDAIYSTAHMLADKGYSQNPDHALYSYNHADWYVQKVKTVANIGWF